LHVETISLGALILIKIDLLKRMQYFQRSVICRGFLFIGLQWHKERLLIVTFNFYFSTLLIFSMNTSPMQSHEGRVKPTLFRRFEL
jgi:hypothetical protein